jgi:hypothetical protein
MKKITYIINLGLLFLWGCTNPFTTREIEEPNLESSSDIFDQPINNEVVLNNFRYAIIQKNISNYMNCFVEPSLAYNYTFKFIPDRTLEAEKFRDWDITYERIYLNTVFNQSSNISLEFLDSIIYTNISQSPDSVQTNSFRYELRISFETEETVYTGLARMKLIKDTNALWAIYYWEDLKLADIESRSWSNLKANYKN